MSTTVAAPDTGPTITLGVAVARLVALVAAGLAAGAVAVIVVIDLALAGPAELYIDYRQATIPVLSGLLPPLGVVALVATAVVAVAGVGRRALVLGALVCMLGALAVTVLVHFPINNAILAWSPAAPPADWAQVRDHWLAAHVVRTALSVTAFALLALDGWRRG